jgi:predicted alpha/beta hydrolase family esterase
MPDASEDKSLDPIINMFEKLDATVCLLNHDLGFCVGVKHIVISQKQVSWILFISHPQQYRKWMAAGATLFFDENEKEMIIDKLESHSRTVVT